MSSVADLLLNSSKRLQSVRRLSFWYRYLLIYYTFSPKSFISTVFRENVNRKSVNDAIFWATYFYLLMMPYFGQHIFKLLGDLMMIV